MIDKTWDKDLRDATLASVMKDVASNASVHYRIAKYRVGQLLYNRRTKQDGFITRVITEEGVITYEVWVPKDFNSWEAGHWSSRWLERLLKISGNASLGSPAKN
jgi:hypothetical protein